MAQLQSPLDQADHRNHDISHGRRRIQYGEQLQKYRLTAGDAQQIIGHSIKVVKECSLLLLYSLHNSLTAIIIIQKKLS
jgi:hypothetical protein